MNCTLMYFDMNFIILLIIYLIFICRYMFILYFKYLYTHALPTGKRRHFPNALCRH